jgi:hypothetical protein
MSFLDRVWEVQHREPTNELERVLHQYSWANSTEVLDIVVDNWPVLHSAFLLEEAFIEAWSTQKFGIPDWSLSFCRDFFTLLDPCALCKAGDPLPAGDSFVVYRGVAGGRNQRRVRGYSWTGDQDVAKLFADIRSHQGFGGFGLPNPAVYSAVIREKDVLAYLDVSHRNEKEFLLRPEGLSKVRQVWPTAADHSGIGGPSGGSRTWARSRVRRSS